VDELSAFAPTVAIVALLIVVGVVCEPISRRFLVPKPLLMLAVGAAIPWLQPRLGNVSISTAQNIVALALVVVLFDGGAQMGRRRFAAARSPVLLLGIVATGLTAGGLAAGAHFLLGLGGQESCVIGAALAPTDPAVVFSVLGLREIRGATGTILEGEAGANDPVGIAFMAAVLAASGGSGLQALGSGAREFALQLIVGAGGGLAAAAALLFVLQRVRLPSIQLYPLVVLGGVFLTYAGVTVIRGSGFLAVFVAGIVMGDASRPYLREIFGFHSGSAALGQLVAFVVLGITIPVRDLFSADVVLPGLGLVGLMLLVVRPLSVFAVLTRSRLTLGERTFLAWSGLKGAVPILLGTVAVTADVPDGDHLYALVGFVVATSLLIQGTLLPWVAAHTGVEMQPRAIEPPWSLEIRFAEPPPPSARLVLIDVASEEPGTPDGSDGTPLDSIVVRIVELEDHP
jgi:cell volume regulation protein A